MWRCGIQRCCCRTKKRLPGILPILRREKHVNLGDSNTPAKKKSNQLDIQAPARKNNLLNRNVFQKSIAAISPGQVLHSNSTPQLGHCLTSLPTSASHSGQVATSASAFTTSPHSGHSATPSGTVEEQAGHIPRSSCSSYLNDDACSGAPRSQWMRSISFAAVSSSVVTYRPYSAFDCHVPGGQP